jgi:hypothetical protein
LGWIVTRLAWIAARLVLFGGGFRGQLQVREGNVGAGANSLLKERDEVSLGRLLEGHHGRRLEAEVGLEVLSDLTNEALEAVVVQ